jgi:hypothetical protein
VTPVLYTAFDLPFSVRYPAAGFFSRGADVRVTLHLRETAPDTVKASILRAFTLFRALANVGGLGGSAIDPAASGIAAVNTLGSSARQMLLELRVCRTDDRSLVTLVDLLLHRDIAPHLTGVSLDGSPPVTALQTDFKRLFDVHPGRYAKLPFAVHDEEPETGTVVLVLRLNQALGDEPREHLQAAFDTWRDFVRAGGFALAPVRPESNYVEPDDPLVDFDTTVEWTLFKLRAHPAALDALINIVARFHVRQSVVELAIT